MRLLGPLATWIDQYRLMLSRVLLGVFVVIAELEWSLLGGLAPIRWPVLLSVAALALVLGSWGMPRRVPVASGVMVCYGAWMLVSANWSPIGPRAFFLGFGGLALAYFAVGVRGHLEASYAFDSIALGCAVLIGLSILYDLAGGADPLGGRLVGITHNPTDAGRVGAILAVTALVTRRPIYIRVGLSGLGCLGVFLADARTSGFALTLGILTILIGHSAGLKRLILFVVLTLVGLGPIVLVAQGSGAVDSVSAREIGSVSSLNGRTDVWNLALGWIAQDPWQGGGTGSSENAFGEAKADGRLDWNPGNAHNAFLQTWLEQGLVGLSLLILLVSYWIRDAFRTPNLNQLGVAIVIGLNMATEALFHEPSAALILLAVLASLAGPNSAEKLPKGGEKRFDITDSGGVSHRPDAPHLSSIST